MTELARHDTPYELYLRGYCSALADLHRANPGSGPMVYQTCVDAGVNEYDFENAGAEIADLGEIAKARDAWKARPTTAQP